MTTEWLEKARGAGRLEAQGEFRLDAERAKEKMARFQLVDPHHYVLELVKAAHLLGAKVIEFEIDTDEMEVFFDGQTLGFDDLEDFYGAAFSSRTDDRQRAVRHMAIAASSAQALGPGEIVVESVSAYGGCRLVLRRDAEPRLVRLVAGASLTGIKIQAATLGTRVYLRQRTQTRHIMQFFDKLKGRLNEVVALGERARYAKVPIFVNRVSINQGHGLSKRALAVVEIDTPLENGRLGISDDDKLRINVLQHGVFIDTQIFSADVVGVEAIVDSRRLTTNLSQSAFVQDEAWQTLHGGVVQAAMWRSLEMHVSGLAAQVIEEKQDWLRQLVLRAHERTKDRPVRLHTTKSPHFGGRIAPEDLVADRGFFFKLATTAIYAQADGSLPKKPLISITEATQRIGELTRIHICRRPSNEAERLVGAPVIYAAHGEPEALFLRFADEVVDLTDRVEIFRLAEQNRKLWEQTPRDSLPAPMYYPYRKVIEHGDLRVAIGLNDSSARGTVIFVKQGRLLKRQHLSDGTLSGLTIIFSGELTPNAAFDGPAVTPELTALVIAMLEALPSFVNEHLQHKPTDVALSYLEKLLSERLLWRLTADFPVEGEALSQWQATLETTSSDPQRVSPWRCSRATPLAKLVMLGPAADLPIFPNLVGADQSLRQIYEHIVAQRCYVLPAKMNMSDWLAQMRSEPDRLFIRSDEPVLSILNAVFGEFTITSLRAVNSSSTPAPSPGPSPSSTTPPANNTPAVAPPAAQHNHSTQLVARVQQLLAVVIKGDASAGVALITLRAGPTVRAVETDGARITLFSEHPLVAHALARPHDPVAVSMLALAASAALRPYFRDVNWSAGYREHLNRVLASAQKRRS
ncbi:MAG: hypothetical protein H0U74_20680 [Bradymonadaceae bacterium]|nr:hypothetical protein [Lujinxingiaceae bacterium]